MHNLEWAANWLRGSSLPLYFLVLLAVLFLYLGRGQMHIALRAFFGGVQRLFLSARQEILKGHARLLGRNREVLLAWGQDAAEQAIEREFGRVHAVVTRDLSGYPALQRQLSDQLMTLDEDYRASTDSPPVPPAWLKALDHLASIPESGDPVVGEMLGHLRSSLERSQRTAMKEYRQASLRRQQLLRRMLPFWRDADQSLNRVQVALEDVAARSRIIDEQMERLGQMRAGTNEAVRALSASSMASFLTAFLVLSVVSLVGFVNFHLIAGPMAQVLGNEVRVGPFELASVSAWVMVMTQALLGLVLLESLRVTHMFSAIGNLDSSMRKRIQWMSGGLILTLAFAESSLAYMKQVDAAQVLTNQWAVSALSVPDTYWVPSLGQLLLGFVLSMVLVFAAIPLEAFIRGTRSFAGSLLAAGLIAVAFVFEAAAGAARQIGEVLVHLYDLLVIFPLKLEELVVRSPVFQEKKGESHSGSTEKGVHK